MHISVSNDFPRFRPNRLIVDEATSDDNSGEYNLSNLVNINDAHESTSRDPQPCNNGGPPIVPWRHDHRSVSAYYTTHLQCESNLAAVGKNGETLFSFA